MRIQRKCIGKTAVPVDGGGADLLDALEQRYAGIGANDVPKQLAEKAYVRVLGN